MNIVDRTSQDVIGFLFCDTSFPFQIVWDRLHPSTQKKQGLAFSYPQIHTVSKLHKSCMKVKIT